jgi:transposase, IS5 family
MPDSASKIVSFHVIDARPIREGRLGKPVEFAHKAHLVDTAFGILFDHTVEIGPPMHHDWRRPSLASQTVQVVRPQRHR